MAETSRIAWTEATWNPITGCSMVSEGCRNCYAMQLAGGRMKNHWSRKGLTEKLASGPVWNGQVRFNEPWLDQPLRWKRPRPIFVVAHGDLFHEAVPDEWIDQVLTVMLEANQHTYQVLTKRPERMYRFFRDLGYILGHHPVPRHIWLGTSVENQDTALERIPYLMETPAKVRWISMEPLLERVNLSDIQRRMGFGGYNGPAYESVLSWLHWVVIGGESPQRSPARPMEHSWVTDLMQQCGTYDVPVFVKQLSHATDPTIYKETQFDQWPAALQVRQYPK